MRPGAWRSGPKAAASSSDSRARSAFLRVAGLYLLWSALAPWTPADAALGLAWVGRPAEGLSAAALAAWIEALRRAAEAAGGYTVALALPDAVRGSVDPWGRRPEAGEFMRALKARWDPAGILVGDFLPAA